MADAAVDRGAGMQDRGGVHGELSGRHGDVPSAAGRVRVQREGDGGGGDRARRAPI